MAVVGKAELGWFATNLSISFPDGIGLVIRMSDGSAVPKQPLGQLDGKQVSTDEVKAIVGPLNSRMFKDSVFMVTSEIGHRGALYQVNILSHHSKVPSAAEHQAIVATLGAWVDANLA
jgi:hypothetical protein